MKDYKTINQKYFFSTGTCICIICEQFVRPLSFFPKLSKKQDQHFVSGYKKLSHFSFFHTYGHPWLATKLFIYNIVPQLACKKFITNIPLMKAVWRTHLEYICWLFLQASQIWTTHKIWGFTLLRNMLTFLTAALL